MIGTKTGIETERDRKRDRDRDSVKGVQLPDSGSSPLVPRDTPIFKTNSLFCFCYFGLNCNEKKLAVTQQTVKTTGARGCGRGTVTGTGH